MDVYYDSLNDTIYAKITPIFGTVQSYIENYSAKSLEFITRVLNVNCICTIAFPYNYNESSHQFMMINVYDDKCFFLKC